MENLVEAIVVTVLGISVVFIILVFIMLILNILKSSNKEEKNEGEVKATAPEVLTEQKNVDDEELIAVITAAVAAAMGRSSNNLVIRSYRKINTSAPIWNLQGRNESLSNKIY